MIEAIIDPLHNHKPSLRACSLVCKAWTHPARLHLLSRLTIKWPLQPATLPYVRHLRIDVDVPGTPIWDNVIPLHIGFRRIVSLSINLLEGYLERTNMKM